MSEPFIGQIEMFGFPFAPKNWALCNGQILAISQYQALFSLLGTYYGGNGIQNFALPNLQSRIPISYNGNHPIGQSAGEERHTLTSGEIPAHTHLLMADAVTTTGVTDTPASNLTLGVSSGKGPQGTFTVDIYSDGTTPSGLLAPGVLGLGGGSQAHQNMMPYTVVNFCIALYGIFPSRN